MRAASVLSALHFAVVATAALTLPPRVETTSGPVLGFTTDHGGTAFVGIPFARALRWGPPRPPESWIAPLNATTPLPGCFPFNAIGGIEDCLVANVWLPAVPTAGRPLIVWIHGGGFVAGSGTGDFSLFAAGTGAVVVALNYRLGALGFLALEGFAPAYPTPAAPDAACANVGLLDQQAGLLWASANAAAFGADPAAVLLMGESAGGSSVLFHLSALRTSFPAYRAALAASPAAFTNSLAGGRAIAAAIAAELGCPAAAGAAAQLACMRAAPPAAVTAAALVATNTSFLPLRLGPVVDGALVSAVPALAIFSGAFNTNASVLVTTDAFEGDKLLFGFAGAVTLTPAAAAAALAQFGLQEGLDGATTARLGAAYSPRAARDGAFTGSSRLWGDGLITCGASWAARGAAAQARRAPHRMLWNATFNTTRNVSFPEQPAGRPTHGSELSILFSGAAGAAATDAWTWLANAAVTGDVNAGAAGPPRVRWPAYETFRDILVVNERAEYTRVDTWQEDFCDTLWLPLVEAAAAAA